VDGAEPPPRWVPRPAPAALSLLRAEAAHRASLPLALGRAAAVSARTPRRALGEAVDAANAVGRALAAGLGSASATPLNDAIGPHRRFDWARFELGAMKELAARLGATVNDVALALVSGAMRRFLDRRGVDVDALDCRAMLPVNVRRAHQQGKLGNRVAFLMARLPVDEPLPGRRIARIVATTRALKSGPVVEGTELLEELSDRTVTSLVAEIARLAARTRSYNMVVTNVPGPPVPVQFLGARMEEIYPLVPLFSNQALGIALFSYAGSVFWGFHADWDLVPDLHDLVGLLQEEHELLRKADAPEVA
jgi:WS/DGAT/MGAT family acyltransferase